MCIRDDQCAALNILEFVKYWKTADREIIHLKIGVGGRDQVYLRAKAGATRGLEGQSLLTPGAFSGDDNRSGASTCRKDANL